MSRNFENLQDLYDLIKDRIDSQDNNSYSSKLNQEGVAKISRKVGEEAIEVIIAAFNNSQDNNSKNKQELIAEISDVIYHLMVLMINQNLTLDDILAELNNRNKK